MNLVLTQQSIIILLFRLDIFIVIGILLQDKLFILNQY